jgi:hypothetical protein
VYLVLLSLPAVAHAQPASPAGPTGRSPAKSSTPRAGIPSSKAGVEVIGLQKQIRTDLDGRYSVKVPPGTYAVRFFAPLYEGARIEKVVVEAGKVASAAVPLKPQGQAGVEVVEVIAQAAKAAEATQLVKRQKASVVSDNIGAETIRKAPDSDAAEIVQRIPPSRSRTTSSSSSAASASATRARSSTAAACRAPIPSGASYRSTSSPRSFSSRSP